MKLIDCTDKLYELDEEATIYAQEPWTEESEAIVAVEPDEGGLPEEARMLGFSYFLEVFIAREVLEDYLEYLAWPPSRRRRCKRIIRYAINDA